MRRQLVPCLWVCHRAPKCVAEELITRSPRVVDRRPKSNIFGAGFSYHNVSGTKVSGAENKRIKVIFYSTQCCALHLTDNKNFDLWTMFTMYFCVVFLSHVHATFWLRIEQCSNRRRNLIPDESTPRFAWHTSRNRRQKMESIWLRLLAVALNNASEYRLTDGGVGFLGRQTALSPPSRESGEPGERWKLFQWGPGRRPGGNCLHTGNFCTLDAPWI